MIGIVSYGFYVPEFRIRIDEIAKVWGKNPEEIKKSLAVEEKSVGHLDEDSLTMAYESSSMALNNLSIDRNEIGVVLVGSESHPYAVNPTSTILGEFLGIEKQYLAFDTQFACKAATGAMIAAGGLISSGFSKYALICAADKATGKPHDSLEYTAASASVACVLGSDDLLLEIVDSTSFSSDTPDFWRREGIRYPSHGGRFTGLPSYFYHISEATRILLEKTGMKPQNFAQAVFHMPNGKFPLQIAAKLGFERKQIEKSLVVRYLGNSYTASALMGLASTLDTLKAGDYIFFASYGSGAGSDAFIFKVTKKIEQRRQKFSKVMQKKTYIDYPTYLKFMGMI